MSNLPSAQILNYEPDKNMETAENRVPTNDLKRQKWQLAYFYVEVSWVVREVQKQ